MMHMLRSYLSMKDILQKELHSITNCQETNKGTAEALMWHKEAATVVRKHKGPMTVTRKCFDLGAFG